MELHKKNVEGRKKLNHIMSNQSFLTNKVGLGYQEI